MKYEFVNKKCIDKNKTLILPSGSSIKNKFKFQIKKRNFKIGYFGSLYKSRGVDLVFELSKMNKNNKYYVYGDLNQIPKSKLNNLSKNLNIKNYVPYSENFSFRKDGHFVNPLYFINYCPWRCFRYYKIYITFKTI